MKLFRSKKVLVPFLHFILSRWWPILGWLIVPLIVVFLGLQLLRYFIPRPRAEGQSK
jgi:hypothetical protein